MTGVFIDSTVFLKTLEGDTRARNFLGDSERIFTNSMVFSEVIYVYLKLKTGLRSYELKKRQDVVKSTDLSKVVRLLQLCDNLPLNDEICKISIKIMNTYGLLPNDALIAATCKFYGMEEIATSDEDFKRVNFLKVLNV